MKIKTVILAFFLSISTIAISAQTASFTYQGKLSDGSLAANGPYQFQFKLYDAPASGSQIGQTLTDVPATVTNGIFAVSLDFGASSFDGNARFLEIGVRADSGQPYTLLTPRQQVMSTPYAVRSLNANQAMTADNSANLGGVPAAQYTQTTDPRLSDDRNPLPGSASYVQNTTNAQANSNFNISGTGKANILEAKTQFNLNGERVLHITGAANTFAGVNAGKTTTGNANAFFGYSAGYLNTTGQDNAFFGQAAGINNTTGNANSFFGNGAGFYNTTGLNNSFYGWLSGSDNTTGGYNAFFGSTAGTKNTVGQNNAFFGQASGFKNTSGSDNSFFGNGAGLKNTTGSSNVFIGALSGDSNTTENNNIFIGYKADGTAGITNSTAIGANAKVTQSNTMVLGTAAVTVQVPGNLTVANTFSANALNSATNYQIGGVRIFHKTGTDNLFAGIDAGNVTTGGFNAFFGAQSGKLNTTGFNNTFVGAYAGRENTTGANNAFFGGNSGLSNTIGGNNAFFGASAGFSNTSGGSNSFFGNSAGLNNSTGLNNSFFGRSAGEAVVNGGSNAFFGAFAGWKTTAGGNSFFGANAGEKTSTGFSNTFVGLRAGQNNLTGARNVFLGFEAGIDLATGTDNIFIGPQSGDGVTGGSGNIRIGKGTFCDPCNNNIAIGTNAFFGSGITNSIAIGTGAYVLDSNEILIGNGETLNTRIKGTIRIDLLNYFPNTAKYAVCQEEFTNRLVRCNSIGFAEGTLNSGSETNTPQSKMLETALSEQKTLGQLLQQQIKQQEAQIEAHAAENRKLQEQITQQQEQLDALKALVCAANSTAAFCQKVR